MKKRDIVKIVEELSIPIMGELGFEIVDIEFVKEGPNNYLRIFIDKPGGITIDDCQKASEIISDKLDEIDPIDVSYYLEVSSPGLDRPLKTNKDLNRNLGEDIEIKLYQGINGKKLYMGKFLSFNNDCIVILDDENNEVELSRKNIAKINLAIRF
ncbi:ribosome maturation factor RimP [Sporanaerobacter acetigenes]|uniref:Ribosome maturation factor RimP n=1 Tax=Sporanaerobacter acetigenes DSM 13106 TaxID=1123281 RepID=A0A1M5XK57_9FIRM|nr:ribosome maturation factor RimP [Sporanaerobacter acetigenes]SHH99894.1 ribosome maturation factor RimP [Sporanaerobacter acetigenes DSM 13106]